MPGRCSKDDNGGGVGKVGLIVAGALVAAASGMLFFKAQQQQREKASAGGDPNKQRGPRPTTSSQANRREIPVAHAANYNKDAYFGKPEKKKCDMCLSEFDQGKHHPIAFIPCKHVVCADCSVSVVSKCTFCQNEIESRTLLFSPQM